MPKKRKTFGQFQTESMNFLLANTPFTNINPGSAIRSIADIMNTQMAELSRSISEVSSSTHLDTASGHYLDLFGSIFGVTRGTGARYVTTAGDKNIKFYVKGINTLARVIGSNSISSGTIITNNIDSTSISVSETVSFNSTDTFVFVGATSSSEVSMNYGANTMINHNVGPANLFVTNTNSIDNSLATENDESFRTRIASAAVASEGANESMIRTGLRGYRDISKVDIRPGISGSGSYDVFLIPTGNRISQSTIASVANILAGSSGFGIAFNIREFDYIPVKIEVKISFRSATPDNLKQTIMMRAESSIRKLIGAMGPGEELSMNRIITAVININRTVSNAEVVFLCINKRVQAIRDLRLEEDELFVPDEDEINPIMVRQ